MRMVSITRRKSNGLNFGTLRWSRVSVVLFPSPLRGPTCTSGSGQENTNSRDTRNRDFGSVSSDLQICVPNAILLVDFLLARIIVFCHLVTAFRPIRPLHRVLHQLNDRFTILQLVDIRNILGSRIRTELLDVVDNSERLKEAKEPSNEISEWRGLVELEVLEDHVRIRGVHVLFA
ncbi:hypothetical protein BDM02DRAFT_2704134 [Thelephora ganbajun]|uniref:Uncharacterized protein n=1 Tax=Thelephora ganbajun TaxID=370292 RepID=A0ACB6YX81_THEGA|nr:hypothetical protein BDM02DRAFT_2704134 [Thelephora ganbajun]